MKKSSRILSTACVVIAAALLFASCSSTEAVKQDFGTADDVWVGVLNGVEAAATMFDGGTYDDDISDCDWGQTSINPIAVVNTYTTSQTFSVTINQDLANNLNFFSAASNGGTSSGINGCSLSSEYAGTQYVTVPAGTPEAASFTVVGWIAAGGGQSSAGAFDSHNVAIGAGGSQWYDFDLNEDSLNNGFEALALSYGNTGGTDPSQNVQTGLFNVLDCSANSSGNISLAVPNTLWTPYSGYGDNVWTTSNTGMFSLNQPICFGFLQPNSFSPSPS
jgi:PBP1b-binding outer membrane lipoprotein LpoB